MINNPDPQFHLTTDDELVMIGKDEAEKRFLMEYA
jgi:K+/H+ antiporter YhaU regulatory subunit KhtT